MMNVFSRLVRTAELAMIPPVTTAASAGHRRLRIAVVQFHPILHDVSSNTRTVERLTSPLSAHMVDILLLPEMCLTGYTFPSPESIKPYLESAHEGPTSDMCRRLAHRLDCVVMAGYPEQVGNEAGGEEGRVGWNSAMVYSPQGELLHNYRKHNLFSMDLPWALPGPSFTLLPPLPGFPSLRVALAICNDLNPPTTLDEWCVSNNVDLLIVLCAWLSSDMAEDAPDGHWTTVDNGIREGDEKIGEDKEEAVERQESEHVEDWEEETASYWLSRLAHMLLMPPTPPKPRFVVICNRTGTELDSTFAGSSVMWEFGAVGEVDMIGRLGKANRGVGLWTVDVEKE